VGEGSADGSLLDIAQPLLVGGQSLVHDYC